MSSCCERRFPVCADDIDVKNGEVTNNDYLLNLV